MTHRRKICIQNREVADLASLLSRLLDEHGWKDVELARRARITAEMLHEEFPRKGFDQFLAGAIGKVSNRLSRIMLGRIRSDRTEHQGLAPDVQWSQMAKEVYQDEIQVYALTLGVHTPWLACAGKSTSAIEWDPENAENKWQQLDYLLKVYEKMAGEMYVFSRIPPQELMPEEFMHAYHDAVFASADVFGSRAPFFKFAALGNERRDWLQKPHRLKGSTFTYMTLSSALRDISKGTGIYSGIKVDLRKQCLEYLRELVFDSKKRVAVVVADDAEISSGGSRVRNLQSLIVCGDVLSVERDQRWKVRYWVGRTGHSAQTVINRQWVNDFISVAKYDNPEKVARFLSALIKSIK